MSRGLGPVQRAVLHALLERRAADERHGHVGGLFWPVVAFAEEVLRRLDRPLDRQTGPARPAQRASTGSPTLRGLPPSLAAQKVHTYRAVYGLWQRGLVQGSRSRLGRARGFRISADGVLALQRLMHARALRSADQTSGGEVVVVLETSPRIGKDIADHARELRSAGILEVLAKEQGTKLSLGLRQHSLGGLTAVLKEALERSSQRFAEARLINGRDFVRHERMELPGWNGGRSI